MGHSDRVLAAAGFILVYAMVIGFTDNYVKVIASEVGLWQFHFTRTCMAMVLLVVASYVAGFRVRPVRWRGVAARSAIHGLAMLIYFGALAFLDVALVAAGLFSAPIWVLLISRFVYGQRIGPLQILAVILGFAGVILVLGPEAMAGASLRGRCMRWAISPRGNGAPKRVLRPWSRASSWRWGFWGRSGWRF